MIFKFVLIGFGMVVGDVLMKSWAEKGYVFSGGSLFVYILAISVYAVSLTYYGKQLHNTNFSVATTLPICINIVTVALLTYFYYKDTLSLYAITGTLFAFVAIIFLSLG